tara:strand:- start:441 stop:557 length:117 start_codon:yes stop_codon:yes gene_type:complete
MVLEAETAQRLDKTFWLPEEKREEKNLLSALKNSPNIL